MLTEQLTQQQLYIRLIAKLFRLLMSLGRLSNLINMLTPLSTLSNFAETRMDRGFHEDAQMNILTDHLNQLTPQTPPILQGTSSLSTLCGTQDRRKALVTQKSRGGHIGVVCMVSGVVVGGSDH